MWTPSGVRMTRHVARPGPWNWLFFPGGPGLGSDSLCELVDAVAVPGASWLVDLPGDGTNLEPPGAGPDLFARWPHVLLEATAAVPNPVGVGHSTGGMHLLSVPAVQDHLVGLVLISSAPDASWRAAFADMARRNPLPLVDAAAARYAASPGRATLRALTVAAAPWSFGPDHRSTGVRILRRLGYSPAALAWSERNFDDDYTAAWWPRAMPTLVVSGAEDRVVTQSLWQHERYRADNVMHRMIDGAGHFPWVERPDEVRAAFAEFSARIAIR